METETPTVAGLNILRKLHAVMKDCAYIQKDKENSFHKYKYASEAAIKEKLHEALVSHGVLPQFSIIGLTERTGLGKEGKEALTTAHVHYRFFDVESGESIEGTFYGCGVDQADKGVYKATTGAIKYILTSQFLIATGDDPENEQAAPEPRSRQSRAAAPPKPAPPEKFKMDFKMLGYFSTVKGEMRKLLDDDDKRYYEILAGNGYTTSKEIRTRDEAERIYRELKQVVKDELARATA
jgi:hypothetical protein